MIHESGPQFPSFYSVGWHGLLDVRNETGRRFRPAGELPSQSIEKPSGLGSIRIVKTPSVKVLRKSRVACTLRHESPFIREKVRLARADARGQQFRFELRLQLVSQLVALMRDIEHV